MFTKMIFVNNCEGSMSKQVNSHKVQKVIKSNCYESYHLDVIFVSLFEMGIFCIYSPRYIHDGGGKEGRKDVRKRSSWSVLHLGHG